MPEQPNIVLICTDQQRRDSLACYGNRFVSTPGTDAMAANGMAFDQAFTPWPVCTPSRATMWTGSYPHAHGVIDNVYGIDNAFATVSKIRQTVFDHLRSAGYLCAHFGKWHLGESQPEFFDVWQESFNSRCGHWINGQLDGVYRPDRATDASLTFLDQQRDSTQPFIMVQSYYPPHDPYSAPKRFYAPYRDQGIPFAGYYAAVSALDENLLRLRSKLHETGLSKRTVVIYYSDHGDTFWYRREGEHKFVCYDDAIRIPFIVEGPGITGGSRSSQPIGLQDLTPTLLELAGVPIPDGLHGRSLKPLLQGESRSDWRDDFYVENITHISAIEQRALRTCDWKLIASVNGQHELYNLLEDPEEELDVFLTPREDPGFERYTHYPDFAVIIDALAVRMHNTASSMQDDVGINLSLRVRKEMLPRLAASRAAGVMVPATG